MSEKLNWQSLIEKFANNTCTKAEYDQLLQLVEEAHDNEGLTEALRKYWQTAGNAGKRSGVDWEVKFSSMLREASPETPVISFEINRKKILPLKWIAAASISLLFFIVSYFIFNKNDPPAEVTNHTGRNEQPFNDAVPGGNKAILTLADGSKVDLDSAQNGSLTTQGNIQIIKGESGLLYDVDHKTLAMAGYNTISTPRGGKYKIVLADGTRVWLNAASSLKFPVSFNNSKIREVTLAGEGYFEVAQFTHEGEKKVPFVVTAASPSGVEKGMKVEVLGTHFNINAYDDENSVTTTLLEGSVKVKKDRSVISESQTLLLLPGQQADLTDDGGLEVNRNANIEEAVAWKDDIFEFNNTSIPTIMRQVSRWYDVDLYYKGPVPTRRFTGKISRDANLYQLIDMLKYTGVNIKMENKKVTISEN